MPKFTYIAMDAKGGEKKGTIDADSQTTAIGKLREMGLFPTNVAEEGAGKGGGGKEKGAAKGAVAKKSAKGFDIATLWGGGGVKAKTLCIFTRQLATLVDAGLPLLRGLSILQKQEKNLVLKNIIGEIATSIESGSTFSEALFQHPKVFTKLYINMVKAGEVGGVLEVVLNRLAIFMEKAEKIKAKIKAAMFYPMAVLFIALSIMAFLMIKIVPQFEVIFSDMLGNVPMPAFTQVVINISRIVKTNFIGVLMLMGGLVIVFKMLSKTQKGQIAIDKFAMKAPVVGDLVRKTSVGRFTRTLGTLVASGVPILQSLQITRDTSGNRIVADAIGSVYESVKEGESIVQPLEASGVFPPMVVSMVDVGETTGALPDMLLKIADNYDEEVDNAVAGMVSLLEPLMIVFLALVVGSIVIALFLPMIKIIQTLGQSG